MLCEVDVAGQLVSSSTFSDICSQASATCASTPPLAAASIACHVRMESPELTASSNSCTSSSFSWASSMRSGVTSASRAARSAWSRTAARPPSLRASSKWRLARILRMRSRLPSSEEGLRVVPLPPGLRVTPLPGAGLRENRPVGESGGGRLSDTRLRGVRGGEPGGGHPAATWVREGLSSASGSSKLCLWHPVGSNFAHAALREAS
mmetsp:Transcript_47906/g.120781  ORF Transcript_47906/g.120781 Transcript_47906/m.120781 type:complete len:207 (+) Transcript_47906:869-1489(+)